MVVRSSERGQASVEWIGLVALIATLGVGMLAVSGARLPGGALARAIAAKIICAADRGGLCASLGSAGTGDPLVDFYGAEIGALLKRHAPAVLFEHGEFSLPSDFRQCRERDCADGGERRFRVISSRAGLQPTAFTRVVDCRQRTDGACPAEAAGRVYLQYWLYYPDSATAPWGSSGYHRDDWESYQVRIRADGGVDARASSHNSYNHKAGLRGTLSDLGDRYKVDLRDAAWGPPSGYVWVSNGSHAGRVKGAFPGHILPNRYLRLVPLEPTLDELGGTDFAITPPWKKGVWSDPESKDT